LYVSCIANFYCYQVDLFFANFFTHSGIFVIIQWFCYLVLIAISGSVFAVSPERDVSTLSGLRFMNLKVEVVLQPKGKGYLLTQADHSIPVELTNRLLVKTTLDVSAGELEEWGLLHISNVQKLAGLQSSILWLVTLSDRDDLQKIMARLQRDARVIYVQPDLLQTRQLAHQQVIGKEGLPLTPRVAVHRRRVRLAIIDDGFNFNHPEFANTNLVFEYDADQRVSNASPKNQLDQHGTLVAGVIAAAADNNGIDGLAPDVELIAIRQVSSWTSDMVLGFSVARMMKAEIVNSSWALSFLPEPLFDLLTDWEREQKPYLIFAAGNKRNDACKTNALSQLEHVWVVGAANGYGEQMPYSNYGSCISLYAPAQFLSTAASGQGYKTFAGTSAAAAYVSGSLAHELAVGNRPDIASMNAMLRARYTAKPDKNDAGK